MRVRVRVRVRVAVWVRDDSILDIVIPLSIHTAGVTRAALVGKSNFFYRKLVPMGGYWDYHSVAGWTRQQELFNNNDLLLIPVCESKHWCLVVINLCAGEIVLVDTFFKEAAWHQEVASNIQRWLHAELQHRGMHEWDSKEWKWRQANTSMQANGYDCAVHVVGYIENLMKFGLDAADFLPSQCISLRHRILKALIEPSDEFICSQ